MFSLISFEKLHLQIISSIAHSMNITLMWKKQSIWSIKCSASMRKRINIHQQKKRTNWFWSSVHVHHYLFNLEKTRQATCPPPSSLGTNKLILNFVIHKAVFYDIFLFHPKIYFLEFNITLICTLWFHLWHCQYLKLYNVSGSMN